MILSGKVVIVTGAGGGIGEGIARVCHREGASVVLADIRGDAAWRVAESLGERAAAVSCDVRAEADLAALVNWTIARWGRVDGLVNNAGIDFSKPFLDLTPEDWDAVMAVDLRAIFLLTQHACRQMLAQSPAGGSIVNISSVHSIASMPGASPYDAAKWGVVGLTKCVAVEFAAQGIRANVVSPGLVNTQIWRDIQARATDLAACEAYWRSNIPMQRVIETEEIGQLTAFLLSERASCITGANIAADAGVTSLLVSREQ